MKRTLIVAIAALALALPTTAATTALAADAPADCGTAIEALVKARADANAGDAEIAQLRDEQKALDKAVTDAQKALDAATDATTIPALQAALNVAKKAAADAQKVLDDKVAKDDALNKLVVEAQVKVSKLCGNDDPAPAPVDLDCADFPLAGGRTAQQVLDETPGEDPHGLDADGDRVACEPGQDTAPAGDNEPQVKVRPTKAPATGTA